MNLGGVYTKSPFGYVISQAKSVFFNQNFGKDSIWDCVFKK
jgi:hypothetical protein